MNKKENNVIPKEILIYSNAYDVSRRTKFEMILSVLYACQQPTILTRLMYKTNINYSVLKEITTALVSRGLVITKKKTKKRFHFNITTKGMKLLQKAREMKALWEVDAASEVKQ